MRAWLRGDFTGVDPREDGVAIRDEVESAAFKKEDLTRLFVGLAALDPIAAAELAAGPRAVAHPNAIRGALAAAEALEGVMSPAGLYNRLLVLAPACADEVLQVAVSRHPTAAWLISLSRRVETVPGTVLLAVTRGTLEYETACQRCAEAAFANALAASVAEQPDLIPLLAAVSAMGPWPALPVAAATVHADPDLLVVEAVAAVVGPNVDAWAQGLFAQTEEDPGFAARYAHLLR